ncbi:Cytochrome P450 [Cordyceps fumosorosea ARSEF 2679]|uniref:Cytochrome P450 n=1 Tax=Cordyceps fumosorosea (strain ARSEF 2679) TaxID=1081104 RepID=A0A167ZM28_CORFA|nr:Cytochrome P450 [Cordyceps fumosorosea ARSEF 2679]OAA67679.1 Cytochrome P450 [Cordyceps fumosorosea ARSEF 2679]
MLLIYAIGIALIGFIAVTIIQALTSPLRSVPGPFLARFTRLWYLFRVVRGHFEDENIALHRRYGPIVRLAPNMFSIDTPEAVSAVYSVGSKMPKSAWYDGWQHPTAERATLFPDRLQKRHAETRRRFQNLYSMTSLVSYEGYVDSCTEIFFQRFDKLAREGTAFDLAHWFQCFAFDVIGDITYSKRFGFLDHGEDISGLLAANHKLIVYGALVGTFPEVHPILYRVMTWLGIGGAAGRNYLLRFTQQRVTQRRAEMAAAAEASTDEASDEYKPQSFLDKMLVQNEKDPEKVTDDHLISMSLANIVAGSDTTAITLSAILYHLMRNPAALARLRAEVDELEKQGKLDDRGHVRFQDGKDMTYLQAVITEALRMHSATGLPLWRDVSKDGLMLSGQYFPEGTTVGLNNWCAHYNEAVFGQDAHEFRPERWLAEQDEVKKLNAYYLPLVPMLVRRYDFEAVHGNNAWETKNLWFVKPIDFRVKVKHRV